MDITLKKQLEDIITKISKSPNAFPFLTPVDPVALNIPDYFDKIKNPMDISTIKHKILTDTYTSPTQFKSDMDLMFSNCYTYNPKDTPVHNMGLELEKTFNQNFKLKKKVEHKKVEKRRRGNMSDSDYTQWSELLSEFHKPKYQDIVWPFIEKITDDVVPGYSDIIKCPTDLQTIKEKLEEREYNTVDEFYKELKLMVQNCFKFNAEVKRIYDCGVEMEKLVDAVFKKPVDKKKRIDELKSAIRSMEIEIEALEGHKKVRPYSLEERLGLGNKITALNQIQTTRIAQIVSKAGVQIDFVGKNLVEIDLRMLSDETMSEIEEFILQAGEVNEKYGRNESRRENEREQLEV